MKKLYLARHAKSSWEYIELDDMERPLSRRGRNDADLLGEQMIRQEVKFDYIVSSPAVRALSTAYIISRANGYDKDHIVLDERLYKKDVEDLLEIIRTLPEDKSRVLLIGHNPEITELANQLSEEAVGEMPTGAIAVFLLKEDSWKDISPETVDFEVLEFPKKYYPTKD